MQNAMIFKVTLLPYMSCIVTNFMCTYIGYFLGDWHWLCIFTATSLRFWNPSDLYDSQCAEYCSNGSNHNAIRIM